MNPELRRSDIWQMSLLRSSEQKGHHYYKQVAPTEPSQEGLMVTVRVIYKSSGKPASGKKVALGNFNGVTDGKWTDSDGRAHFDVKPGRGKVFVDGSTKYEGNLAGQIVVYI